MEQPNYPIQNQPTLHADDQREIVALLRRQNELLENLERNLMISMQRENNQSNTVRTRVIDVNMSVGAMVGFMLKWLIASIPVAIIIGLAWVALMGILALIGVGVGSLSGFR